MNSFTWRVDIPAKFPSLDASGHELIRGRDARPTDAINQHEKDVTYETRH